MDALEKIYLTTFGFPICEPIPQDSSNPDTVWSEKPYEGADSVEYTRTDAFIEKAVGYLYSKLYDWVQTTNPNQRSCANTIMKQNFIEDFRKYMEGEEV